jgi:hypothetical protein
MKSIASEDHIASTVRDDFFFTDKNFRHACKSLTMGQSTKNSYFLVVVPLDENLLTSFALDQS